MLNQNIFFSLQDMLRTGVLVMQLSIAKMMGATVKSIFG